MSQSFEQSCLYFIFLQKTAQETELQQICEIQELGCSNAYLEGLTAGIFGFLIIPHSWDVKMRENSS